MTLKEYQVCIHCNSEQQAMDILSKVKELDHNSLYSWKYECWEHLPDNNNGTKYHEVLAWVEGLENASSAQILLSDAMNYVKEAK